MAQYVVNPVAQGRDPRIAQGARTLASVLAPDPNASLEAEMNARNLASQVEQNYSGVLANEALARQRDAAAGLSGAQTTGVDIVNRAMAEYQRIMTDPAVPIDQRIAMAAPYAIMAGFEPGAIISTLPAFGMGFEELDPYVFARDGVFGDTRAGTLQAQDAEAQLSLAEDTRRADLELLKQANDATTDFFSADSELVPVLGSDGLPVLVPRREAVGMAPAGLPETSVGGARLLAGDVAGAGAGRDWWDGPYGTSQDGRERNFLMNVARAATEGVVLPPHVLAEYTRIYQTRQQPRTETITLNGRKYTAEYPPTDWVYPTPDQLGGPAMAQPPMAQPPMAQPPMAQPPMGLSTPGTDVARELGFSFMPTPAGPSPALAPGSGVTLTELPGQPAPQPERPGAEVGRTGNLSTQISGGALALNSLFGFDPMTGDWVGGEARWLPGYGTGAKRAAGDFVQNVFGAETGDMARNLMFSDIEEVYDFQMFRTIEPLLRLRSGAATPEEEVARYRKYMPQPGQSPDVARIKLLVLNQTAEVATRFTELQGMSVDEFLDMAQRVDAREALAEEVEIVESIRTAVEAELAATEAQLMSQMRATQGTRSAPSGFSNVRVGTPGGEGGQ